MSQETAVSESLPADLAFLAPVEVEGLVRVGDPHDGGYVVPSGALDSIDTLISFGISGDWSFEAQIKERDPSIEIQAYDHTIGARAFRRAFERALSKWLRRRISFAELRKRYRIWRSYKRFFSSEARHFKEKIHAVNASAGHATIDKVFGRTDSRRVLLKIDIEGSEYGIINDVLRYADRIKGIVIEFHETLALRETFCSAVHRLMREFYIAHVHGNNYSYVAPDGLPNVLEMTLIVGAPPDGARHRRSLPVAALDGPNQPERPDWRISFPG